MDNRKETKTTDGSKWLSLDYFRENVKSILESKGMLYKDLAMEIGTTGPTISRYLTGARDPELEYVYRLSKCFGVTIDFLLGVNNDNNRGMTEEQRTVLDLYNRASEADQMVIKAILQKYEAKVPKLGK